MDNAQIIERLKSLEDMITKTEPDNPDDKTLFTDHTITTQENLLWVMNLTANGTNHDPDSSRERIIQIMKDSNRIWGIRNKIHSGDWDGLEMLEVEDIIKDFLSRNEKINAIKYYRSYMKEELKVDMGLRQAKETIDAIGEGRKVDLSIGYK